MEIMIQQGSDANKKQALQRLCLLTRRGFRSIAPVQMKSAVLYALGSDDLKVRRWAFNALALIGDERDIPVMEAYWRRSFNDPDVFEAGLTALAQILDKPTLLKTLSSAGVALSPRVVMALAQHPGAFDEELAGLRLDLSKASAGDLRSATLLVGLQRAPDTLFSDRHPVSSVIGDLNTHDDGIVAQYSFWATVEHPDLDLGSVSVPPAVFSQLRPNVQAWAYRVLTKDNVTAKRHYDLIVEGSESDYADVREGVAMGLRDIFYDSLDTIVIDWSLTEEDIVIREKLWEHMAVNAEYSPGYREEAEKAYRSSSANSALRARLEAAGKDQGLLLTFRKIALQTGDPDLFTQIAGNTVTNNIQNFQGPLQAGAISNAGPGNTGTVSIGQQQQAVSSIEADLKQLLSDLQRTQTSPEQEKVVAAVEDAIKTPTRGRVGKVLDWLKSAKEGMTSIADFTEKAGALYTKMAPALEHLPDVLG
ncbi:hypothetical protein J2W22_003590 [Sphingomonas kyeonggiensis]|uniref:HEAT repeat domain-containing protein n=1 Tax=Sphingomonas kyeonggiensis TaxID=1268553 RepID=UPI002783F2BB|nr:HEAT repeat domain-containing protein [Sphingomonas kyeonggiensis]MDQ0251502.1 hypothetical protein [Sphingomonas kyeonggiensis]